MSKNIALSDQYSKIEEIEKYYTQSNKAFDYYFMINNLDFIGLSIDELNQSRQQQVKFLDRQCSLELLSFLEARFRIDYIIRCKERKKDSLSKAFREIQRKKNHKISLIDDIVSTRKQLFPQNKPLFDQFQKSLDYRNWLAHGRYWEPIRNPHIKKYDYLSIQLLTNQLLENIDLYDSI